ncbi:MAG TPA: glycosyltransferase, partial [Methylomirabilota bacterium]|nr:glycosyltransferase [Methylomirabilota bacterium]
MTLDPLQGEERLRVLFVHTRFPGQFARLAAALVRRGHDVRALTTADAGAEGGQRIDGIPLALFDDPSAAPSAGLLAPLEAALAGSSSVAVAAEALAGEGYRPDLVYAHAGWGAGCFLKDVFPTARVVKYFEWYFNNHDSDADFGDPGRPLAARLATRLLDLPLLLEFASADAAIVPTRFQADQFPALIRDRLEVVPDGVDTDWFAPDADAAFALPGGRRLTRADKVVTYVARGADPYRGFRPFMLALAALQARDADVEAVIAGDDRVHYGPGAGTDDHKRAVMAEAAVDPRRTHFVGRIPLKRYRRLLQVSAAHVHLSVPFVLSWSVLEAMACGCAIVGSMGMPLEEVLTHRRTALLAGFDDVDALAGHIAEARAG